MIGTNTALQGKKKNSTAHRDTTRARSRPPSTESGEPSNVRHDEHTARRKVDFISKNVVCGSQPGLEMTSGGLTGNVGQHCMYVYKALLWHCRHRQEQYVAHQMVLPIIVSISCTGVRCNILSTVSIDDSCGAHYVGLGAHR